MVIPSFWFWIKDRTAVGSLTVRISAPEAALGSMDPGSHNVRLPDEGFDCSGCRGGLDQGE